MYTGIHVSLYIPVYHVHMHIMYKHHSTETGWCSTPIGRAALGTAYVDKMPMTCHVCIKINLQLVLSVCCLVKRKKYYM